MKFSTYDSAGPASLDLTSGVLKHGANIYKCNLSGDIQVGEQNNEVKGSALSSAETQLTEDITSQNSDQDQDVVVELEFWRSVKDSDDPDSFHAYLDKYPNGKFAILAKIKIKKLRSSKKND